MSIKYPSVLDSEGQEKFSSDLMAKIAALTEQERADAIEETRMNISRLRISFLRYSESFMATLVMKLDLTPSFSIPYAATNGRKVLLNPVFFNDLTEGERNFLVLHEVSHVVYMHLDIFADLQNRSSDEYSRKLFNCAGDYVINAALVEQPAIDKFPVTMPKIGLLDKRFSGMHTQQVYKILQQEAMEIPATLMSDLDTPGSKDKEDQDGSGDSENNTGTCADGTEDTSNKGSTPTPEEQAATRQDIQDLITEAANEARLDNSFGNLPAHLQRMLEELNKPKINYKSLIRTWVSSFGFDDYTWQIPDRRFNPNEVYIPSMEGKAMGPFTIAVDTSGSVTQAQLTQFVSEIWSIVKTFRPPKVELIAFDNDITNVGVVKNLHDIAKFDWKGGGGTDLTPVFDRILTTKPQFLIVFSDLYCNPIIEAPKSTQVLWVVVDNRSAQTNFGKMVHIDI